MRANVTAGLWRRRAPLSVSRAACAATSPCGPAASDLPARLPPPPRPSRALSTAPARAQLARRPRAGRCSVSGACQACSRPCSALAVSYCLSRCSVMTGSACGSNSAGASLAGASAPLPSWAVTSSSPPSRAPSRSRPRLPPRRPRRRRRPRSLSAVVLATARPVQVARPVLPASPRPPAGRPPAGPRPPLRSRRRHCRRREALRARAARAGAPAVARGDHRVGRVGAGAASGERHPRPRSSMPALPPRRLPPPRHRPRSPTPC